MTRFLDKDVVIRAKGNHPRVDVFNRCCAADNSVADHPEEMGDILTMHETIRSPTGVGGDTGIRVCEVIEVVTHPLERSHHTATQNA